MLSDPVLAKELPRLEIPGWLAAAAGSNKDGDFPLKAILTDSLYYPGCGFDGTPVRYLNGHIVSFMYVDYCVPHEDLLENLETNLKKPLYKK
jgi:hypothetical protein